MISVIFFAQINEHTLIDVPEFLICNMDSEISNYSVTGRIGEGAHGLVFRATHIQSGREVALKKILIKNLEDGIPVNVMREIKALQLLRCKYVSILLDYSYIRPSSS